MKKRLRVVVEADESGRVEELAEGYSGYVPVSLRQVTNPELKLTQRATRAMCPCLSARSTPNP